MEALTIIAARHATGMAVPLIAALIGTGVISAVLLGATGFLGHSPPSITIFQNRLAGASLLGLGLVIVVLVVMLVIAVAWNGRRVEAAKRSMLAEIAATFPDPASHALAMVALRDLPGANDNDVLGSIQHDLRKTATAAGNQAGGTSPVSAPAAPSARFCSRCGKPVSDSDRFCSSCGATK